MTLKIFKYLSIFTFDVWVFCLHEHVRTACMFSMQAGQRRGLNPLEVHLQRVVSTIYILGTDTGSSEEATRALKCPAIYTAPWHQDFYKQIQFVSIWKSFFLIIHNHESLSTSELWPFLKCREDQRETELLRDFTSWDNFSNISSTSKLIWKDQ